jgi:hypothetical protein
MTSCVRSLRHHTTATSTLASNAPIVLVILLPDAASAARAICYCHLNSLIHSSTPLGRQLPEIV